MIPKAVSARRCIYIPMQDTTMCTGLGKLSTHPSEADPTISTKSSILGFSPDLRGSDIY
jgi:hypothetical protein